MFLHVRQQSSFQVIKLLFFILAGMLTLLLWATLTEALGQRARSTINNRTRNAVQEIVAEPLYRDYKGVSVGATSDEVHGKLGAPAQSDATQDFYVFSETETAQIFYDNAKKVTAISVDYLSTGSNVPDYKTITGAEIETRADGSLYKLVRYTKAGYWVSYNRTAGATPITTVTIQKIAQ